MAILASVSGHYQFPNRVINQDLTAEFGFEWFDRRV
jgi:hypothetical protein